MAIGATRPRPGARGRAALTAEYSFRPSRPPAWDWTAARGPLYWHGGCDLAGGFPGFAQRGGFLARAQVRISSQYFLVDEGGAHGFGIPLSSVTSAFAVDQSERGDALVRLQYLDDELTRTFTVRFRGPLAALRPDHRARQMVRALQATGATNVLTSEALPEPELRVPWSAAEQYHHEPVQWQGQALAPVTLGEELRPSDVWLTAASVIWGCGSGNGINRLPLDLARDVIPAHVEDRAGTPAIYLGFGDAAGRRHEVAFLFNRARTISQNEQQQVAFLTALRQHGLPLGCAAGRGQPWRLEPAPDARAAAPLAPRTAAATSIVPEPEPVAAGPGPAAAAPEALIGETSASSDANMELPTGHAMPLADLAAPDQLRPPAGEVAEPDESLPSPDEVTIVIEPTDGSRGEAPDEIQLPRFRQLEALALHNLAETLQAIDDRLAGHAAPMLPLRAPSPAEQTVAAHELADAAIAGQLTWEAVYQRRARLTAALEATPRLRTLLELHESGHLDDAVLRRKRQEVTTELSSLITVPGGC